MRKAISFLLFVVIMSCIFCSQAYYQKNKVTPNKVTPWPRSNPTGPKRWAKGYTKIEYGLAVNSLGDTIRIKEFHQYKR